jgi:hypothetical protein
VQNAGRSTEGWRVAKSHYLDPRWQKFRLAVLNAADWQCERCGATDEKLNVHHFFYVAGRKPWQYAPETVESLCDECHKITHELDADIETGFAWWEHRLIEYLQVTHPPHWRIQRAKLNRQLMEL